MFVDYCQETIFEAKFGIYVRKRGKGGRDRDRKRGKAKIGKIYTFFVKRCVLLVGEYVKVGCV